MLSNTAETKPRPIAVCQDAAGSFSTGISDAQVTSASRKIVPLKVSGITFQSGLRHGVVTSRTTQTDAPMIGKASSAAGNRRLAITLDRIATIRIANTITTRL